jgi:hypothetical protein
MGISMSQGSSSFADALNSAFAYAANALPPHKRLSYGADWITFSRWCRVSDVGSLPATSETIAAYLAHLGDGGIPLTRIRGVLAAIAWMHRTSGVAWVCPPLVRDVLRGIERVR